MELSKRKGKAVCVAKGKETVAHQVLDGDLEKTVKFLREKNVGIVICDERELNQVINWTGLRGIALCQAVLAWFMIYEANTSIGTPTTATSRLYSIIWHCQHCFRLFTIRCLSFDSNQRRGFGRQPNAKNKDKKAHKATTSRAKQDAVLEARKTSTRQPGSVNRAPRLSSQSDGKSSNIAMDLEFEER